MTMKPLTMLKSFGCALSAIVIFASLPVMAKEKQQNKPNVVFILADNVGYGDMGPYGGGELRGAPTPNIDRLAREGLCLTQFLVEPACTPSRAALMTGQYSIRNGLSLVIMPGTPNTLPGTAYTMGQLFKDAGYATAIYGKWHLGIAPESLPTAHGFDEFYGLPPDLTWNCAINAKSMELMHASDKSLSELREATEGAIRTCCFIRWPGKVKPSTSSYAMFSIMDFLPTFTSIIGSKLPDDRPIDGVDQTDVLFGKSKKGARDSLLTFIGADLVAVRWKQWRAYMCDVHPTGIGPQRMPGIFSAFASLSYPTLYNIEMDPHEDLQVAGQFAWILTPVNKVIKEYTETLKKYPNPPPPNLTKIPAPEFKKY